MSLDFSKLHDALAKVADLAKAHASVSALVADASAARDAALADLREAQDHIETIASQLLSAASTEAEKVGLTAVAGALSTLSTDVAPAAAPVAVQAVDATGAPVAPPVAPAVPAPAAAAPATTFLPGDPRAVAK